MTFWQAPPEELRTVPAWQFHTTPTEVFALDFDTTPLLGVGQTPTLPKVICTDATTGRAVALAAPSLVGNVITVVVKGLTAGHIYDLEFNFTISATHKPSRYCAIFCR